MLLALPWVLAEGAATSSAERRPDVRFEPTDIEIVRKMLELAEVKPTDVVYDLGCGDGRIVIEAVKRYGARGVCVEIDPKLIEEAKANAREAGVEGRIEFRNEDLLTTPLRQATVVTLFLSVDMNLRLRPKLWRELKSGARVVSHWHRMGDWTPQKSVDIRSYFRYHPIYLWTIE